MLVEFLQLFNQYRNHIHQNDTDAGQEEGIYEQYRNRTRHLAPSQHADNRIKYIGYDKSYDKGCQHCFQECIYMKQ
ncbi:hypothetical protein D3C74_407940 [compost metagenome]